MELNYFISGSLIDPDLVKDKWLDSTGVSTRGFAASKKYTFTGFDGSDDFSIFFTFDKYNSSAGNLLSNVSGNSDGFCVAFNSNNELFVKTFGVQPYSELVNGIRLGVRNCLGLVKNNRQLTVYKYNLQGTGISQDQSFFFPLNTNVGTGRYYIGSGADIFNHIGLGGISGVFDQMVSFNVALTYDQCLSVFSGFQPYTLTRTPTYSLLYQSSGFDYNSGQYISEVDLVDFSKVLNQISSGIPNTTGNYSAYYSGNAFFTSGLSSWSGYYALTDKNLCYSTGAIVSSSNSTTWVSRESTDFRFTDDLQVSMNNSGEKIFSHFITCTTNETTTPQYFSYNLYQKYKSGFLDSLSLNNTYKTGFYMNGIITNNPSGICLLANVSGETFNQIGYNATFDRTLGLFVTSGITNSGFRIYWGPSGLITGYSISGQYVDFPSIAEDASFPMFYDLSSGNIGLVHSTLYNYATGRFDPESSIAFSGLNSWSDLFRVSKEDYWETSVYHLAHGDTKILPQVTGNIYLNYSDYWV